MRADNTHHLIEAARHRTQQTRDRAIAALRRVNATGQRINFDAVARQAGVSRSWLYTQDDLRDEIDRMRARHHPAAAAPPVPDRQRASDASLLRRLEAATAHTPKKISPKITGHRPAGSPAAASTTLSTSDHRRSQA